MINIFNLGIKHWMIKILFVVVLDIIIYGLILQSINGYKDIIFLITNGRFINIICWSIFFINTSSFNCQRSTTKVWGLFFVIVSVFSLIGTLTTLNFGKNEVDIFIKMDNKSIFEIEKENTCCLDLINPNCGCFELEGTLSKKCQYIKSELICSFETIHCRKCLDHSNNVFFISSIHNCIQNIALLFVTLFVCKEWYLDSLLNPSQSTIKQY
ncbi:hypothetical protein EDI_198970 [Entamoeba dispar SAW760]|uniref:Uncharacterized protein n=1 Tax=Entamoeba dispar (strain ATCC PRA-260 / SAW760) TaxID=370354 RepID=B0EMY4_ENTDS|nr:uncharacterized protein EDI_198970 [Entamoeba dispar SAW760]EDR24108.1 hypothetical protein EDI_198970 [Entamoeba dispar SAW760]|eukprot:EDR24108.1 hypothetical protein EDI_198970 [Entamoeba dispar SAW760]